MVGVVSLVGVLTGQWWLLALVALQLALGLTLGRRWCLACVAYFELIQPRFGEGPLEDARPPRFANLMGVVVLTAGSAAYLAGLGTLGRHRLLRPGQLAARLVVGRRLDRGGSHIEPQHAHGLSLKPGY